MAFDFESKLHHRTARWLRGAIFENFVHAELRKIFLNVGQRPPLYFWRDSNGREVDFLLEYGGKHIPIEAKSGQTVAADFFRDLDFYCKLTGRSEGILVYGGRDSYRRKTHHLWSWTSIS